MALFAANTLFKVTVSGTQDQGTKFQNVFHFWMYASGASIDRDQAEAGIRGYLQTLWNATINSTPTTTAWLEAAIDYHEPGAPNGEWSTWKTIVLNFDGNDASHDLPAGVSAVVTGLTSAKKKRGRKFLPPFGEVYSQDQAWTVQALTRLADWAAKWVLGHVTGTSSGWLYPIICEVGTTVFHIINAARANVIPGYQRRRKPGVGY